jgi:hypothetical protein
MGVVLGPEIMNDTCGKTMYMGMMDRGFRHTSWTPDIYVHLILDE